MIAGKLCYPGFTIAKNNDTVAFYYTEESLPVSSPLNYFLPSAFAYNVMSVKAKTDWTLRDGSRGIGTVALQVNVVRNNDLPDSKFDIPSDIPIRKNVTWNEIMHWPKQ